VPLPILQAEGVFLHNAGIFTIENNGETQTLNPILDVLEKYEEVFVLTSHVPSSISGQFPILWGFGCCKWQPTGNCPYGHHLNPCNLYFRESKGKLSLTDGVWLLDSKPVFDLQAMSGHVCRVMLCPSKWSSTMPVEGGEGLVEDLMQMLSTFGHQ